MSTQHATTEAVGLFSNLDDMQEAIADLEASGFERRQISVLGNQMAMKSSLGKPYMDAKKLEDDPRAPRSANVAPEDVGVAQGVVIGVSVIAGIAVAMIVSGGFASIGSALSYTLIGFLAGTMIGVMLAKLLGDRYRTFFEEQLERDGGLLVWVRTRGKMKEKKACSILKKHAGRDVHVHQLAW